MKIIFEKLRYKNVLSYGNKVIEYNFQNGIDLVVGSNGLGKSTFVDALTYGLFGKPFRKIKIGSLVNNKNNREMWVGVIFTVNGNRFSVERGIKPALFKISKEVGGKFEQVEKPSTNRDYQVLLEETILQFGENVYRQLIALGANLSSSKNFMDLTKTEKEEVLQVITDTAIFNKIKEKVREEKLVQKTNLTEYNYKVEVQQSTLNSVKMSISSMERQNAEFNENKDNIIEQLKDEEFDILAKLDKYPKLFLALDKLHEEWTETREKTQNIDLELDTLLEKEQDVKAKIRKLVANEKNKIVCPNCSQEIKEALPYTSKELKIELESILGEKSVLNEELGKLEEIQGERYSKFSNRARLEQNERELRKTLKSLESRISKTNEWQSVQIDYSELEGIEEEFIKTKDTLVKIKGDMADLIELEDMVSDKNLKGVILNQQLPFLNKYINEFLEIFDSKFNFVIDNEFNEKIVSRNSNNDFNSLSNGQKQRISLSILFAFLKLIEEKNGVSTNLLILDEYLDSSLDLEGIDEVMIILDEIFSKNKDVILISHNPDIKNKSELLNRLVYVQNLDNFSWFEIEKVVG